MQTNALIVETDPRVIELLSKWLEALGYTVETASNAVSVREALAKREHDAVFCACTLEASPGRTLLAQIAGQTRGCRLIGLGFRPGEEAAQNLIRRGVLECLRLPLERGDFLLAMKRSAGVIEQRFRARLSQGEAETRRLFRPLVAATSSMIRVMQEIEEYAALDTPLLIVGEHGVGKESVARAVHAHGPRRRAPFVRLDAAGVSAGDFDLLLFGESDGARAAEPRRVARSLEGARGGSLFVDGLDRLSPQVQQRLAGLAPQAGPQRERSALDAYDLRLMASLEQSAAPASPETSRDLPEGFNASVLRVPPLRERREDIPLLVDHFVGRARGRERDRLPALNGELLTRFSEHPWPGNLRELENVIERGLLMARSRQKTLNEVLAACLMPADFAGARAAGDDLALRPARKEFERAMILRALQDSDGNRTHAARKLRISHRALLYKLKSHEITDD